MSSENVQGGGAPKRQKVEEDPRMVLKNTVFTAAIHWYYITARKAGIADEDLYVQEILIAHMFNTLKHVRQEINGKGSAENRMKWMSEEIVLCETPADPKSSSSAQATKRTTSMAIIKEILIGIASVYSLSMSMGAEWIGVMTPILATFSLFKACIEELRMGHTKIPRGLSEKEISYVGLSPIHGSLLEGIRWSPHLRSTCPSACGPLTQVIFYRQACRQSLGGNINSSSKWAKTLQESLSHLPRCSDIIEVIPTATYYQFRTFLPFLANVLLLSGSQNKKTALPMYAYIKKLDTNAKSLMDNQVKSGEYCAISIVSFVQSGRKACEAYNSMGKVVLPIIQNEEVTSQLLFHGVFGSYSESLELLKWMTNSSTQWATRKEIGKEFLKMREKDKKPIDTKVIKRYSKPSSSNESIFYQNIIRLPSTTFSDAKKKFYEPLISYLNKGQSELVGINSIECLKSIMQGHLEWLRDVLTKNQHMPWVNAEWEDLERMEDDKSVQPPSISSMRMFMENGNYDYDS